MADQLQEVFGGMLAAVERSAVFGIRAGLVCEAVNASVRRSQVQLCLICCARSLTCAAGCTSYFATISRRVDSPRQYMVDLFPSELTEGYLIGYRGLAELFGHPLYAYSQRYPCSRAW